jgi:fucose 4-O-acetylase-like acetyltransferase
VRFVAIALVVVGHTIEPLSRNDSMYALYLFIYAFHMPLFALVSGVFARAEPVTRREGGRVVSQLLAPYVLFSVIWAVVRGVVEDKWFLDLGSPYWHLWFLTALAAWRLVLPVFGALRYPVATAVAVSVASGYMPTVGWEFDASRTLGMLPFFVLGWALTQRGLWPRLRRLAARWPARAAALAVLVVAMAFTWRMEHWARGLNLRGWVQLERNYADLRAGSWTAGTERLALLGVALLLCLAVLAVTPSWDSVLSRGGRGTMYVYMLHLFPVYALHRTSWFDEWFVSGPRLGLLVLGAVVLAGLLSTRPVRTVFRPLVEPRLDLLLRAPARSDAEPPVARP